MEHSYRKVIISKAECTRSAVQSKDGPCTNKGNLVMIKLDEITYNLKNYQLSVLEKYQL